jgi:hypothetical protein
MMELRTCTLEFPYKAPPPSATAAALLLKVLFRIDPEEVSA